MNGDVHVDGHGGLPIKYEALVTTSGSVPPEHHPVVQSVNGVDPTVSAMLVTARGGGWSSQQARPRVAVNDLPVRLHYCRGRAQGGSDSDSGGNASSPPRQHIAQVAVERATCRLGHSWWS